MVRVTGHSRKPTLYPFSSRVLQMPVVDDERVKSSD